VIDTATGLEYLNLRLTAGVPLAQVVADLAPGGEFAGFRYPTLTEVYSLVNAYFMGPQGPGVLGPLIPYENFAALFGPTGFSSDGYPELDGFFNYSSDVALTPPLAAFNEFYISYGYFGPTDMLVGYTDTSSIAGTLSRFTILPTQGSFLVRAAPVVPAIPEPSSLGLLGIGLALFAHRRRVLRTCA